MTQTVNVPGVGPLNFPDGMSQEDMAAAILQNYPEIHKAPAASAPVTPTAAPTPAVAPSVAEKLYRGAKDPLDALVQLADKAIPASVQGVNRSVNNWLADKLPSVFDKMPESGASGMIANQEVAYQAQRKAAGESGLDAWRLAGNVASPANLAIAARAPQAASLMGRVGVGAGQGALSGLLNPVTDGDFWAEKAKQVGMGSVVGGAVPVVTGALSRVVSPNASTNVDVQVLKDAGIKPTIGQTLGGWANSMEEKAQSLPILGDMIRYNRRSTWDDLNRAGANRALEQVGEELPKSIKPGNETSLYVRKKLGGLYDELVPQLKVQADQPFMDAVDALKANVKLSNINPESAAKFERFIDNAIVNKFQGQAAMTGQTYKGVQSDITNEIKSLIKSTDSDQVNLLGATKELGKQFEDLLIRSNPDKAAELKALNKAWANFKIVQRAGAGVGAHGEAYTPAQLFSATKAQDFSKDKGRFSEGLALMQDLSGAGKRVLGDKIADSGTTGRSLLAALGLGAVTPGTTAITAPLAGALTLGAGTYLPPVQSLLRGAVSARPAVAQPVAEAIKKSSPYLIPAATEAQLRLMNDQ